jgi:glycosyltransferase involved in cell wall biosynthesis
MVNGQKVVVVLPAYNAAKTLKQTCDEIDTSIVDDIILVDDASKDDTIAVAQETGINHIVKHEKNKGYGGNQKSCYSKALEIGADIIIMLHPDYQYTPALIGPMAYLIANGVYPVVLGSRILGKGALRGGMPLYKYFFNRVLTLAQNILMGQKLSEYHTGYRAYHKDVLLAIPYLDNSDDFVFDNELIAQIFYAGFEIAEITCPTRYFEEASSINFNRSVIYGAGVLRVSLQYALQWAGLLKPAIFKKIEKKQKQVWGINKPLNHQAW